MNIKKFNPNWLGVGALAVYALGSLAGLLLAGTLSPGFSAGFYITTQFATAGLAEVWAFINWRSHKTHVTSWTLALVTVIVSCDVYAISYRILVVLNHT